MKTLIELYDERPLENVLSTEMFRPERTILLVPDELENLESYERKLQDYFRFRGIYTPYTFETVDMYNTNDVYEKLVELANMYDDLTIDITGGTDAALFATGLLSQDLPVSVMTYSRRKNKYFSIQNAQFADEMECNVHFNVESFLRMAGGAMRRGRFDQNVLENHIDYIDPFFNVYLAHKKSWLRTITYIQNISLDSNQSMYAQGKRTVRTDTGKVSPNDELLEAFQQIGLIHRLHLGNEEISFEFHDHEIRFWLRDIGSVLELYVYKACLDIGFYDDVVCSAVVDWEGDGKQSNVTNEIDVLACREVSPFFISCKTNSVKTEALNELAVLRNRFGGLMAHSAIVTTSKGGAMMKRRAIELNIHVIDIDILKKGELKEALKASSKRSLDKGKE